VTVPDPTDALLGTARPGPRWWEVVDTSIDPLLVVTDGTAVVAIHFTPLPTIPPEWARGGPVAERAAQQLRHYFAGRLTDFTLPLAPAGTPFQRRVWAGLLACPYGTTLTYGTLAERVGMPGKARAIGAAVGANPIAVVIPCHRIVGADGTLTGYAGGLPRKAELLRIEGGLALTPPGAPGADDPLRGSRRPGATRSAAPLPPPPRR